MMNYLWAGLIAISLLFALGTDVNELRTNRYRNGVPLAFDVRSTAGTEASVAIAPSAWRDYFGVEPTAEQSAATFPATLVRDGARVEVQIRAAALPAPLDAIRKFHDPDAKLLVGNATLADAAAAEPTRLDVAFAPVRFVRLRAINEAAVAFAQKAFEVSLSLVGGLALWLGLLKIAEDAGLVNVLVRVIRPVIGPLFPGVPRNSPALGLIALNVAANMLSLGNAATPIGIKAMQELQKLNPTKDTATNAMVMLLAINTAGVTLLPSPSLVGIMGPRIGAIMMPIIATTTVALVIAIVVCKAFERFGRPVTVVDESTTS